GGASSDSQTATDSQDTPTSDEPYVQLPSTDSHEQAWIGEGMPVNASKPTTSASHNRLNRTPNKDAMVESVVCNDAERRDERDVIDDIYGSSESLPFDVSVHNGLTRAELRNLLANPSEFLHYVGHVDEDGFRCIDGTLD